jgi:hypothetical protein
MGIREIKLHVSLTSLQDGSECFQAPAALLLGKNLRYPLDRRLVGPHNQPAHGAKEKDPKMPRIKTRSSSAHAVTSLTYPSLPITSAMVKRSAGGMGIF